MALGRLKSKDGNFICCGKTFGLFKVLRVKTLKFDNHF